MMQKATKLKCIQNLEAPTKGAGNSFAVLDSQYLAQIADKIDISLGIDTHECLYNVDSMKNDENKKSEPKKKAEAQKIENKRAKMLGLAHIADLN